MGGVDAEIDALLRDIDAPPARPGARAREPARARAAGGAWQSAGALPAAARAPPVPHAPGSIDELLAELDSSGVNGGGGRGGGGGQGGGGADATRTKSTSGLDGGLLPGGGFGGSVGLGAGPGAGVGGGVGGVRAGGIGSIHAAKRARSGGGGLRCARVLLGGATAPAGLCEATRQRRCDRLICTRCDFEVVALDDRAWRDGVVDELFFRNAAPDEHRLAPGAVVSRGAAAYCCQCSWRTLRAGETEEVTIASDVRWVCGGHAGPAG